MTGKTIRDYYAILGVSPQASLDEIRQAYRNKARLYHPDLNNSADAETRFREVNEAYEILANPQQRKLYDHFTEPETIVSPQEPYGVDVSPADDTITVPHVYPTVQAEGLPETPIPGKLEMRSIPTRNIPPTWALLLIMIGAFIIIGVGAGLLLSSRQPKPGGNAAPASVLKIPTFTSPPAIQEDFTVIQESGNPVFLNPPRQLNVRGQQFEVVPVLPQEGRWPLPETNQQLGMWIHGTVINYVVGLPYLESTESLLAGLGSGDQLVLILENGSRLTFGSPMVQRIALDDLSPLAQDSPGVTLVLLGGDQSSRLMIQARYLPQGTDYNPVHVVGGLKVEVLKTWILDEVSSGAMAFVVEYQLTNESTLAYNAAYFEMSLEDATGRRFIPNAVVSRNGENGELSGNVDPGTVRQGSVGYLIPRESPQPLTWIFRNDVNSTESARLVVPFEPPAKTPAQPDVQIRDIFVDESRGVVVVSGELYNDGGSDLMVSQGDISLSTPGGESAIRVATPFLPWTVPAQDSQDFEIQFALPRDADTAVLDILGFAYEIEGILP